MTKISGPSVPSTRPGSLDDDGLQAPAPTQQPAVQARSGWGPEPISAPRQRASTGFESGPRRGGSSPAVAAEDIARATASASAATATAAPTIPEAINSLATCPGFKQLTAGEQAAMNRRVSSGNSSVGVAARSELRALMTPDFAKATPEAQATALRKILTDEHGTPDVVASNAVEPANTQQFTIGPAKAEPNFAFDSGAANAQRFTVTVNGHNIDVIVADNHTANQHSLEQVAKGLAALPEQSLALVHNVMVEPNFNPADAHWAQVYHMPDFHSYMTAGSAGDVRIYPTVNPQYQAGMDCSLIHETGHVLSKRQFGEDSTQGPKWKAWNDAAASDGLHASQYARSSGDEDFAETLALYQQAKGTPREAQLRQLYPARFAILDTMTAPAAK